MSPSIHRAKLYLLRAALLFSLALASCTDQFGPESIAGATPLDPPDAYRTLWAQVETCAGLTADFDRVRWYVIEGEGSFEHRGQSYFGYWWPTHEIILAGYRTGDTKVIRHEMLHDILGRADHPPEYFVTRCGAIVR